MWAVFRDFLLGPHWHAFLLLPPPPNRDHCHWKGEIFLLVRIARCVVGGNVSLRFSDAGRALISARGLEEFSQPSIKINSSLWRWLGEISLWTKWCHTPPPLQINYERMADNASLVK